MRPEDLFGITPVEVGQPEPHALPTREIVAVGARVVAEHALVVAEVDDLAPPLEAIIVRGGVRK